jgi:NADH:ubiquinone oxidoreductase subunit D
MESLIWHFKLIYDGIKVPAGETYFATEGANGELGYYLVSDGGGAPYRIKVRPPCFAIFQAYPQMLEGHLVADAIAILSSLNIIAGELDR